MNLKEFLKPFMTDRAVWTMAVTWIVHTICRKAGMDLDESTTTSLIGAVVTWVMVHFVHVKTVESKAKAKE